jgi:hypothetical protein
MIKKLQNDDRQRVYRIVDILQDGLSENHESFTATEILTAIDILKRVLLEASMDID